MSLNGISQRITDILKLNVKFLYCKCIVDKDGSVDFPNNIFLRFVVVYYYQKVSIRKHPQYSQENPKRNISDWIFYYKTNSH